MMGEKKKNKEENFFWPGFFLGASLGAGLVYFLGESNPEKRDRLLKIIRELLAENREVSPVREVAVVDGGRPLKSEAISKKRVFVRQGRKLKK